MSAEQLPGMLGVTSVSVVKPGSALALTDTTIGQPAAASAAGSDQQITMKDFMFQPTSLKVKANSTVTWVNKDGEPHTVVSVDGLFRSGALDTDDHFSFKFDKPGSYRFVCSIHPQMVGTIEVA